MRNIPTKQDNVDTLSAAEFNGSVMEELENSVTNSGITLDPAGGPDTDTQMLAQSLTRTSQSAATYQDSGAVNAYVLTAIGGFVQPSAYIDGMTIRFKAGNTNTGASTVNLSLIGVVDLVDSSGSALTGGEITANLYYEITYDAGNNRFEVTTQAAATTPDADTGTKGVVEIATESEIESENATGGTGASLVMTPADAKFHPGSVSGRVNFNGIGVPSIRDSHNVSSITDLGVGRYRINISSAMANSNFTAAGIAGGNGVVADDFGPQLILSRRTATPLTTTSIDVTTRNAALSVAFDTDQIHVVFIGDQ